MSADLRFAALCGLRILVVEDEYMVAESLVGILEGEGATIVGPFGWIDEALAFVRAHAGELDGAVLDVNLHGSASYPIADILIQAGVTLVFSTGYDTLALDPGYRCYPRCEKPFQTHAIIEAFRPPV